MYAIPATPLNPLFAAAPAPAPERAAAVPTTETVTAPVVVQRVTLQQTPSRSDLLLDTQQWTWAELRDYVVAQIIERFGPFPRDARKEYGIFSRYFTEYGQSGIAVAQYVFGPVCEGWWGNAPVSVNRFCRASDAYFSIPIIERLKDVGSLK